MGDKRNRLFLVLCAFFVTNALLAEFIGVKVFSLERSLGLQAAEWQLFGANALSFNLTTGVLVWPFVFIATDIINEYFGRRGVQKISWIAVACIAYGFFFAALATYVPPAPFWREQYATGTQALDINYAYKLLFRQGMGIIVGSLVAFLVGQLVDVWVFHRIRRITGHRYIGLRATGSTLVSQLIDSFLVLYIAFYLFAPAEYQWSWRQILSVATLNYLYKFVIAILLTPLIYLSHRLINRYLGKSLAEATIAEAARTSSAN